MDIINIIQGDEKLGKVEINRENIGKCLCKTCPVQTDSNRLKEKWDIINEKLKQKGDIRDIIKPEEELPLVYCSFGKKLHVLTFQAWNCANVHMYSVVGKHLARLNE